MKELKEKNTQWYEVVDCVCIQQMSQDEASEYLHVPKQDLKSRLYRARQFLRDIFENER
jgi:DNA-directed RNA polymerase specialized sigma24 family protein